MNYLYNGVELPALPEWDKTTYPYAYIVRNFFIGNSTTLELSFWCTQNPIGMYADSSIQAANNFMYAGGAVYSYNADTFAWELHTEYVEVAGSSTMRPGSPIWCNTDVLYKADDSLYLAASDPVSAPSPLVVYTELSPNCTSPRKSTIDTITIHCTAGQMSIERLGNMFAKKSKKASSNYGVDKDGRIGLFVEEKDRAWTSGGTDSNGNPIRVNGISGADNDHRAITIEVSSDATPPYAVNDKTYAALIELVADICKRNNILELKWKADKTLVGEIDKQNMTVHRWFANKSCPGDYLYERLGDIANKVNIILKGEAPARELSGPAALIMGWQVSRIAFTSPYLHTPSSYGLTDCVYTYLKSSDEYYLSPKTS